MNLADSQLLVARHESPCRAANDGRASGTCVYCACPSMADHYKVPTLPGLRAKCPAREGGESLIGGKVGRHPKNCRNCQGRGWVPMTDYATVMAAVREKGWRIEMHSNEEWAGDFVLVKAADHIRRVVEGPEGHQGIKAILVALLRALMALPDNDDSWMEKAKEVSCVAP